MRIIKATPLHVRALQENFRFVEDALRTLDSLSVRLKELVSLQKMRQNQLAKVTAAMFLEVDLGASPKNSPNIGGGRDVVHLPGREELTQNLSVISEMWSMRESLKAMETKIRNSFPKAGANVDKALVQTKALQKSVDKALNDAFVFVQNLAKGNMPVKLSTQVEALQSLLETGIAYTDSASYSYVFEADGELVFSHYIHLKELTDDDGEFYHEMFVILSYRTGNDPATFLAVSPRFVPPGDSLLFREVKSMKELVQRLNQLFALESFSNSIGSIPISVALKDRSITKEMFQYQNKVKSIEVTEDRFIFTLKGEVQDLSEVDSIAGSIFKDLRKFVGNMGSKLRMSRRKGPKAFQLFFLFSNSGNTPMANEDDIDFLRQRFRLNDATMRQIVDTINRGQD